MSTSPTIGHAESYPQPVHREQVKKKENPNLRSNAFLARLLGFKKGGLEVLNEFKTEGAVFDRGGAYALLSHAAAAERNLFWETGDNQALSLEERKAKSFGGWSNSILKRFGKKEGEVDGGIIETGSESDFFEKVGIQLESLDDTQMEKFYVDYCGGGKSVETFIGKMATTFSPEEITANIDKIQFLAGMFGEETAKDVVGLLTNPDDGVLIEQVGDNTAVTGEEEKSRLEFLASIVDGDGNLRSLGEVVELLKNRQEVYSSGIEGYGVASAQGLRPKMEDRAMVLDIAGGKLSLVLDGHGGAGVADLGINNLPNLVDENIKKINSPGGPGSIQEAIRNALAEFADQAKNYTEGSTLALTFEVGDEIFIANIGDSEVGIAKSGQENFEVLSEMHNLGNDPRRKSEFTPDQDARILTRAFGDNGSAVKSDPHISSIKKGETTKGFMVLASDGFFETISWGEVNSLIEAYTTQNPDSNLESITNHLVNLAIQRGSGDNVSLILRDLRSEK